MRNILIIFITFEGKGLLETTSCSYSMGKTATAFEIKD